MVRFFSFILAIYFLTLAAIPCGDKDNHVLSHTKSSFTVQASSCQDTNQEDELCSPLCMCNCCGGVTIATAEKFKIKETESQKISLLYSESKISSPSFTIWQPPKI